MEGVVAHSMTSRYVVEVMCIGVWMCWVLVTAIGSIDEDDGDVVGVGVLSLWP